MFTKPRTLAARLVETAQRFACLLHVEVACSTATPAPSAAGGGVRRWIVPIAATVAIMTVAITIGQATAQTTTSNPFATTVTNAKTAYDQIVLLGRIALGAVFIFCAGGAAIGRFPKQFLLGGIAGTVIVALAPQFISWVMSWGGGNTADTILGS